MVNEGQKVTGKLIKVLPVRGKEPQPDLSHISGALFDIGNNQTARMPISHALVQKSEYLSRQRIATMVPGTSIDLEVLWITRDDRAPWRSAEDGRQWITVSERVRAGRALLERGDVLYQVMVVEERVFDKGVQVEFPDGFRAYAHQAFLGLPCTALRRGALIVVRLTDICTYEGRWYLHMRHVKDVDPADPRLVRFPPGRTLLFGMAAAMVAVGDPDGAADFIKNVTAEA